MFLTLLSSSGAAAGTQAYIKVGGVWLTATVYIKVGGSWSVATPYWKDSGNWN